MGGSAELIEKMDVKVEKNSVFSSNESAIPVMPEEQKMAVEMSFGGPL
jgi:hypothetical protein